MGKETKIYNRCHLFSGILMIVALLWLTVSIPYVYKAQQKAAKNIALSEKNENSGKDKISSNPFANSAEEKAPSGSVNPLSEEYIHHAADLFNSPEILISQKNHSSESEYLSFHGELICPPPEV